MSNEINVNIRLPQGTPLSVILFILYINDIADVTKYCEIVLFAHDTVLIAKGKNKDIIVDKINEDLKLLYECLCENKLMLNVDKTKCHGI